MKPSEEVLIMSAAAIAPASAAASCRAESVITLRVRDVTHRTHGHTDLRFTCGLRAGHAGQHEARDTTNHPVRRWSRHAASTGGQ